MSDAPEGDDQPSGHDESAAGVDGQRGRLTEADAIEHLSHEKKEDDVEAEQLAEVPAGDVDDRSVGREGECAGDDGKDARGDAAGAIKAGLKEGVSPGLKKGGEGEDGKGAEGIGDETIEAGARAEQEKISFKKEDGIETGLRKWG